MKLRGTKKNKIAKTRSRKQKVISAGMGLKTLEKMFAKSANLEEIRKVIGDFTDLRTITGTFVVGYELEFGVPSFIIESGSQRRLLKEERIPFGIDKIFLSGDYIKKNKFGVDLNSLIEKRQHPYLYVPLMYPELIYLTVGPSRFGVDIYKMYYIMFYRLLFGRIIYLDDDIIAINISYSEPHVIIVIPNTRKQMRIEDQPDIEPIFQVNKSKMQCTVDIPVQYYNRILDIFIILLLPDKDNTGNRADIIDSNENLELILWCKNNCQDDQFAGLILYYYLCYLKYHLIRERNPDTSKYTKGSISFAFRHNLIEMLQIIVRRFESSSTTVDMYRTRLTAFILGITHKIFSDQVPRSFIDANSSDIIDIPTGMTYITLIFDNFTGLGITKVDIEKDGVTTFKLEFRSFSRDDTVVKISKIFDVSKFKFDDMRLTQGKQVVDVLTIDCLQKLIDPNSRMLTNNRLRDIPDIDNVVRRIKKILDTANRNVLLSKSKLSKIVKDNKNKRLGSLKSIRSAFSADVVLPALSDKPRALFANRGRTAHSSVSVPPVFSLHSSAVPPAVSAPPVFSFSSAVPPAVSAPPVFSSSAQNVLPRPNTRKKKKGRRRIESRSLTFF